MQTAYVGNTMAKRLGKKPAKEKREAPVAFRIKPSIKRALAEAAEADRRTVSAMLELLLEDALRERGFLK